MSELETPPTTGLEAIDAALAGLDPAAPLADQAGQYAEAVELLQQVLNSPPGSQ